MGKTFGQWDIVGCLVKFSEACGPKWYTIGYLIEFAEVCGSIVIGASEGGIWNVDESRVSLNAKTTGELGQFVVKELCGVVGVSELTSWFGKRVGRMCAGGGGISKSCV